VSCAITASSSAPLPIALTRNSFSPRYSLSSARIDASSSSATTCGSSAGFAVSLTAKS
jgi:hypothetical protein